MPSIENLVTKSLTKAYSIFDPTDKQTNYHFSFGFIRQKLIGIGQNDPIKVNGSAMTLAKKFSNPHFQEFPYKHSETDLIKRLWGKVHLDRKVIIVNVRFNRNGTLKNSRPCANCQSILDALDLHVIWSVPGGFTMGSLFFPVHV